MKNLPVMALIVLTICDIAAVARGNLTIIVVTSTALIGVQIMYATSVILERIEEARNQLEGQVRNMIINKGVQR